MGIYKIVAVMLSIFVMLATADVLLMWGSDSAEAAGKAIPALMRTLPQAETVEFAGMDHFGPEEGGADEVAQCVSAFFQSVQ